MRIEPFHGTPRRRFLAQSSGVAATLALNPAATFASDEERGAARSQTKPSYLLVHGAWQGAWVWSEVIKLLTAQGLTAHAFDLPGSGDDQMPASEVTLDAYAKAIIKRARAMPSRPLVLVGHSMGGAAITAAAAAAPELFSRLVYLCAFLPRPGESVASLAKEGYALGGGGPKAEVVDEGKATRLVPDSIVPTFFNDIDPQAVAHLVPRFRPQPIAPVMALATWSEGLQALPKTYIHCTRDQAVSSTLQQLMALRAEVRDVRELDSGHEPFITQPASLTALLMRVAQ